MEGWRVTGHGVDKPAAQGGLGQVLWNCVLKIWTESQNHGRISSLCLSIHVSNSNLATLP